MQTHIASHFVVPKCTQELQHATYNQINVTKVHSANLTSGSSDNKELRKAKREHKDELSQLSAEMSQLASEKQQYQDQVTKLQEQIALITQNHTESVKVVNTEHEQLKEQMAGQLKDLADEMSQLKSQHLEEKDKMKIEFDTHLKKISGKKQQARDQVSQLKDEIALLIQKNDDDVKVINAEHGQIKGLMDGQLKDLNDEMENMKKDMSNQINAKQAEILIN